MPLTTLTAQDDGGLGTAIAWALVPLTRCVAASTPGVAVVQLPDVLAHLDNARQSVAAPSGMDDGHREDLCHHLTSARDYARTLSALAHCRVRHRRGSPGTFLDAQLATQFARIADAADAALAALDALPAA